MLHFCCGKSRPQTKGQQFSGKGGGRLRVEHPASASRYGEPVIKSFSKSASAGYCRPKLVSLHEVEPQNLSGFPF